ncbi:MAG: efflux RND transporter periplasmic adaptor subunit [Burkholderiales bacterium]|nr:efflux RND transporter periplasmic adaptor subunit [Burkholderiales bacterium]
MRQPLAPALHARSLRPSLLFTATLVLACLAGGLLARPAHGQAAARPELAAATAQAASAGTATGFDGVVEAVRQTVIAAQVSGAVVQLDVKVGDRVAAGQLLLRIDARAADQSAAAGDAQVAAARALLEAATKDYQRQQQLFKQNYISQAALDRAESDFKSTQAQVAAQLAQAGAARTQSGFYVVRAPYAGVVAEVPVMLGDMAMPGRPLVTLYDPAALRITAALPQTVAARLAPGALPRAELPGLAADRRWPAPAPLQLLPLVDAATHTVTVRMPLPAGLAGVAPGQFARLWLPAASLADGAAAPAQGVMVPAQAIVRRAELNALYVIGADGKPLLRQVRLGRSDGDRIEVLSGLTVGERVALDPQAAAKLR